MQYEFTDYLQIKIRKILIYGEAYQNQYQKSASYSSVRLHLYFEVLQASSHYQSRFAPFCLAKIFEGKERGSFLYLSRLCCLYIAILRNGLIYLQISNYLFWGYFAFVIFASLLINTWSNFLIDTLSFMKRNEDIFVAVVVNL